MSISINLSGNQQYINAVSENKLNSLKQKISNSEDEVKAAQEFEALFVKQMLEKMTSSLEGGNLVGDAPGADFYQDMLLDEIAKQISVNGELGLAKQIRESINQESGEVKELRSINVADKIFSNVFKSKKSDLPKILQSRLRKLNGIVLKAAKKFSLDPKLIKSIIAQESYGNPKAQSPVGAKGLMQLMDGTAADLNVKDSFDPEENIMGGSKYLKQMMDKYGDLDLALAAYNAGPGNVDKYGKVPPFKETENYIRKVKQYYHNLP